MLRVTQNSSAEAATRYFDEGLSKSDYYAAESIAGQWGGRAATALGLSGDVSRHEFQQLSHNINPATGKRLTARTDTKRTVGYDFTFNVPKSVSIVHGQTSDPDIVSALNSAVTYAMGEAEQNAQARVRKNGQNENVTTGNLLYASFVHSEARPVKGQFPDPHLHTHCFVFNATYDDHEKLFKAGQFRNLKASAPYYEALFHSKLAYELQKVGYRVERSGKTFELSGFSRETIEKFSRRTQEINEKINELGLEYAEDKAQMGAKTRAGKRSDLSREALQKEWASRLNDSEWKLIQQAKGPKPIAVHQGEKEAAEKAVSFALAHLLERKSVVEHREWMTLSLKHATGTAGKEAIEKAIASRKDLLSKQKGNETLYTNRQTLAEEQKLIQSARQGQNQFKAIDKGYVPDNPLLNQEQKDAVKYVLESRDFITLVVGRAGTGKTWTMKEIAKSIESKQVGFHAFAPSATASREVQRQEGFSNATTIAALLKDQKLQDGIRPGDVIWLDEAGLVGCETFNNVVDLAKRQKARVLLSGDARQHSSVERGDALRLLQTFGGLKAATIQSIQRQKNDLYRKAVKSLSEGDMGKGYRILDEMGAIKQSGSIEESIKALSEEYVSARLKNEEVLVVSTTHSQGKALTDSVRELLKKEGKLTVKEKLFETQTNLSFTEAEKKQPSSYIKGQSVQFHQNATGFVRGEKYNVVGKDDNGQILLEKDGQTKVLPLKEAKKFSVYEKVQSPIAKGDLIRITQNAYSLENKRLNNGCILTVSGFDTKGNILAKTSRNQVTLGKDFGHFTHGYYSTSPGSQGKSVNRVLVLQTSTSGRAASQQQFYVSTSRARFQVAVHTDDKARLLESIHESSARLSATELMSPARQRSRVSAIKERVQELGESAKEWASDRRDALRERFSTPKRENEISR
ncbi:MobF family relaxase [Arsenicibacter rosenii]|uniref:AAA+ ATPase domain-containing protein n=1 Tax=Arsenicibacter rosenii TaxID=1750698 RepID=A0A1S2VFU1_9BACT|nr:MobF family relaxase [Arsenicibacter rosenii]OIN57155.1 hypothetical protein BLX24_21640 [Arsenicibacter rosenii]